MSTWSLFCGPGKERILLHTWISALFNYDMELADSVWKTGLDNLRVGTIDDLRLRDPVVVPPLPPEACGAHDLGKILIANRKIMTREDDQHASVKSDTEVHLGLICRGAREAYVCRDAECKGSDDAELRGRHISDDDTPTEDDQDPAKGYLELSTAARQAEVIAARHHSSSRMRAKRASRGHKPTPGPMSSAKHGAARLAADLVRSKHHHKQHQARLRPAPAEGDGEQSGSAGGAVSVSVGESVLEQQQSAHTAARAETQPGHHAVAPHGRAQAHAAHQLGDKTAGQIRPAVASSSTKKSLRVPVTATSTKSRPPAHPLRLV